MMHPPADEARPPSWPCNGQAMPALRCPRCGTGLLPQPPGPGRRPTLSTTDKGEVIARYRCPCSYRVYLLDHHVAAWPAREDREEPTPGIVELSERLSIGHQVKRWKVLVHGGYGFKRTHESSDWMRSA
ncbi:MAG: hypothetical protein ACODAJ_05565 [Planctomycetota bacterium]